MRGRPKGSTNKAKRPVGRPKKAVVKPNSVWYAIGTDSNPDKSGEDLYSYNSLEAAIEGCVESGDHKMYAFKIELLGEIEIKREIKYNIKQVTNGK